MGARVLISETWYYLVSEVASAMINNPLQHITPSFEISPHENLRRGAWPIVDDTRHDLLQDCWYDRR